MKKAIKIVAMIMMLVALVACSNNVKTSEQCEVTDKFLELVKEGNYDEIASLCESEQARFTLPSEAISTACDGQGREMIAEKEKDFDAKINDLDVTAGKKAVVKYTTKSYDFGKLEESIDEDLLDWTPTDGSTKEFRKALTSIIEKNVKEMEKDCVREISIELVYDEENDKWLISDNTDINEIVETIYGNPAKAIAGALGI